MNAQTVSSRRWLIAYDVHDPRRRRRVAALLEAHGIRVQRSVFVTACTQHQLVGIVREAERRLQRVDRLAAWPIGQRIPVGGQAGTHRTARLPDFWIVQGVSVGRYIVSYDCSDDARRARLRRLLTGYGMWVQFSVFECVLTEGELGRLLREIARCVDNTADSVLVHRIGAAGRPKHPCLAPAVDRPCDYWLA